MHIYQYFAGRTQAPQPPTYHRPIYPDILPRAPSRFHLYQSWFGPASAFTPPHISPAPIYPNRVSVVSRVHFHQFWFGPSRFATHTIPGSGPSAAATFALSLEPGTKITLSWGTDIFKSYSGIEQRCNTTGPLPRQRIEGSAFLLDGPDRDIRGALQRAAAAGSTFLLALPYEELQLAADAIPLGITGFVLPVLTTTRSDWAIVTQRVLLIGTDDSTVSAVIQAVTSTTITVDTAPGTTGRAGARIQPLLHVLLDPQQGLSRYAVNAGTWSLRALANAFGWVGADSMGKGAQIATYATGGSIAASTLTDQDLLIWDHLNEIVDTAAESMLSLGDLVDLGALPFGIGGAPVPDWARPIKYSSTSVADWQWLKAFLRQTLGRQGAFLLPTGRADLIYVSTVSGGIKVASASTGALDYTLWWASAAHRRLVIAKADGTTQYVTVASAPIDNHDGTLTLSLDASVTGTVTKISLLEQVRLDNNDSDDIPVTWDGAAFSVDLIARTTEETITAGGPMSGITRDATSGIFTPQTAAEWSIVLGLARVTSGAPSAVYGFQEASGNIADAVGGFSLVNTGAAPTYQSAVTGWSRKSILTVDGGSTSFRNTSASLPDISTASCSILAYLNVTGSGVVRTLFSLGTTGAFLVSAVNASNTPSLRISSGGGVADGAQGIGGAVRPIWLTINRTVNTETLSDDRERIVNTFSGIPSGKQITMGSSASLTANCAYLYAAAFFGAAAELTTAQQRAVLQVLGWTIAW